ncbi:UNVERIFIED_CONTAM: hypothetical protein Sradi_6815300 [Sesamum radiatum]|uniref:Uncharacterized protein n=1 Tax=Sesamum radiatum TaxID=300843 RepID=A0AAW2JSK5_SESRA
MASSHPRAAPPGLAPKETYNNCNFAFTFDSFDFGRNIYIFAFIADDPFASSLSDKQKSHQAHEFFFDSETNPFESADSCIEFFAFSYGQDSSFVLCSWC